jgi:hypothetical protein
MMQKKPSESSHRSDVGQKCQTHEDRCSYYNRFLTPLKSLALGTMMLTAGMSEAMADQSRSLQRLSDNPTGQPPAFPEQRAEIIGKSPTESYVPAPQPEWLSPYQGPTVEELWPHLHEQMVKASEEKGEASKNSLQGEAQERYDETSLEQREQGKPLSSNEEKIATLKAVTEKAGKNPEFAARVRKLLAEGRAPSEQESSEARRKLEIDNRYCLDVSPSIFISNGVFPTTDPAPGYKYQTTLEPFVANNCPLTVTDTQLTIGHHPECPAGTQLIEGGQNYDVPGPSPISPGQTQEQTRKEVLTSACAVLENGKIVEVHPPSIVDVSLQANAHDDKDFERFSETFNWDVTP